MKILAHDANDNIIEQKGKFGRNVILGSGLNIEVKDFIDKSCFKATRRTQWIRMNQNNRKNKKIAKVLNGNKYLSAKRLKSLSPLPSHCNGLVSNKEFNRFFSPKTVTNPY